MYGIDFGARYAGTTVVAFTQTGSSPGLQFMAVAKGQDADAALRNFFEGEAQVAGRQSMLVLIDAPLGLPPGYFADGHIGDLFYRPCDRELGAMSPMFIGGLTARAMALARDLRAIGFTVLETYPAALARHLELHLYEYKKGDAQTMEACSKVLAEATGLHLPKGIPTWHHFDAMLGYAAAHRYTHGKAYVVGSLEMGCIVY